MAERDPLLRPFGITLIWGLVEPGTPGYRALFRALEDGSLTDADDAPVELPAAGLVRLMHPLELDEDARARWQEHLADYEVTPPFPQLARPVVRVDPACRAALWWTRYEGYVVSGAALKGRYTKAGWERGSVGDGGVYSTLIKAFPAAGIEAVLETGGLPVGYEHAWTTALVRLGFVRAGTIARGSYVYDDPSDGDPRLIPLGEVAPLVFSEAAGDVERFAAGAERDEHWMSRVG